MSFDSYQNPDRVDESKGHLTIVASKSLSKEEIRRQAIAEAEKQGAQLTDEDPVEIPNINTTVRIYRFKIVRTPSFVSVSLTPEARDALRAYAKDEQLSLSDAVLKLTETLVGEVVVIVSQNSGRDYEALRQQARHAANHAGGALVDIAPEKITDPILVNGAESILPEGYEALKYTMVRLPR